MTGGRAVRRDWLLNTAASVLLIIGGMAIGGGRLRRSATARPVWIFTGRQSRAIIANLNTGNPFEVEVALANGETFTVDSEQRTIISPNKYLSPARCPMAIRS